MLRNIFLRSLIFLSCLIVFGKADYYNKLDVFESLNTLTLLEGLNDLDYNSTCLDDLKNYTMALMSTDMWAMQMFDSSAKVPDGILMGNFKFLGHFDECIAVEQPQGRFTGQYCMLNIDINLDSGNSSDSGGANNPMAAMGAQTAGLPIFYALCLPSTCTPPEIQYAFNYLINITKLGNSTTITVDEANCQTKEWRKLTDGDWVVVGFLVFFVAIALISTAYDTHQRFIKKNEKPHPLLSSFSIYSNGKQLFKISNGADQLGALHGIRVLSMCWVILCHAYVMTVLLGAPVNFSGFMQKIFDKDHILIANAFVSVDSFFFLSGLLVSFVFFREIGRKGNFDVILGYIHRYIRLTPPFAVMMLINATLFPYMGNGPLWHSVADFSADTCRENWWSGMLYVQNYVAPEAACLGQSWYLSADMQMYWLSPFVLFPLLIWPLIAPFYLGLLILGATFTTFAIAYVNDLGPSPFFTKVPNQMDIDYVPFHTRLAPYLVGLATGYIICGIKAKKIKIQLSAFWVTVGWLLTTGICLGVLYGFVAFEESEYTTLQSAFFLSFHRLGWGVGLAWIVFACVHGYGGPINTFLSWNIFQPLGKLSYNSFLIHMTFQYYRIGTSRTSFYAGDLEIVYYFLGDLVLANLASIPFTLIFEMPFGNIDRYVFRNVKILPLPWPKNQSKVKKEDENKSSKDAEQGKTNEGFENETK